MIRLKKKYEIESELKSIFNDFGVKYDKDSMVESVSEKLEVSEDAVESVIDDMIEKNIFFEFDKNTVVRQ